MKDNQLESGSYTSIFEIFVIGDAGGFLVDDTIIYHVYGDSHCTIKVTPNLRGCPSEKIHRRTVFKETSINYISKERL